MQTFLGLHHSFLCGEGMHDKALGTSALEANALTADQRVLKFLPNRFLHGKIHIHFLLVARFKITVQNYSQTPFLLLCPLQVEISSLKRVSPCFRNEKSVFDSQ